MKCTALLSAAFAPLALTSLLLLVSCAPPRSEIEPPPPPPVELSLEERQRIFREYMQEDGKITQQAEKKFPNSPIEAFEFKEELRTEYKASLAAQERIPRTQLEDILTQAKQEKWTLTPDS